MCPIESKARPYGTFNIRLILQFLNNLLKIIESILFPERKYPSSQNCQSSSEKLIEDEFVELETGPMP